MTSGEGIRKDGERCINLRNYHSQEKKKSLAEKSRKPRRVTYLKKTHLHEEGAEYTYTENKRIERHSSWKGKEMILLRGRSYYIFECRVGSIIEEKKVTFSVQRVRDSLYLTREEKTAANLTEGEFKTTKTRVREKKRTIISEGEEGPAIEFLIERNKET